MVRRIGHHELKSRLRREHQPRWYKEREQEEMKQITPLMDDIKVLSELKSGNYQEKEVYDELKTEILDFHYERLDGIHKDILEYVKGLVRKQDLLLVI